MKAYPLAVRHAIMAALDGGMPKMEAARVFGVGLATVKRYAAQRRAIGTLAPRPHPGRRPLIAPDQHVALLTLIHARPTASLAMACDRWEQVSGIRVSPATLSRTLHRLGVSRRSAGAAR
jgi:transposase